MLSFAPDGEVTYYMLVLIHVPSVAFGDPWLMYWLLRGTFGDVFQPLGYLFFGF